MNKWPDGTPKSTGNAFDWRGQPSMFAKATPAQKLSESQSVAVSSRAKAGKPITIGTKKK